MRPSRVKSSDKRSPSASRACLTTDCGILTAKLLPHLATWISFGICIYFKYTPSESIGRRRSVLVRVDDRGTVSVECVRNPLKSAIRWWLAGRLPADLEAGDLFLVRSGDGGYKVAKLLAIDASAIHVRLYKEGFSEVPRFVNTAALSMGTVHDTEFGIGHLPISRASFASWRPIRLQHEPVTEDELEGYRMWKDANGGIWG